MAGTLVGLCASVAVYDADVSAQGWLEDRRRAEGIGIRVGDLELHPGIGAEVGYDSNVFLQSDTPESSLIARISP
ncbi:MAG: hypothetical protein RMK74_09775, partial [Myxococcales bacterium]|nr:hypothetical protein [Myxococcales bacterium]